MKVTIDIVVGHYPFRESPVYKQDFNNALISLDKAINLKPLSAFDTLKLMEVSSIIEGIQAQLPTGGSR